MPRQTSDPEPPVVAEIERHRALGLLHDSPAAVVVISAPAGSGKSVLVRQWVARDARPHVTLRLAPYLDDAAELCREVVGALEALGPAAPAAKALLTGTEPAFSASVLPELAHVARSRGAPYVLVVEDVHLLSSVPAHRVLQTLCEAVPDGSTVVLTSRALTPDWLARLRSTGRLVELTSLDLDLDLDEAAALLAGLGLRLDPAEVAAVVEHTEGWAVGVYLTGLSLRSRGPRGAGGIRLARGSDRAVADYLRTEVLAPLPEDHRRFLTLTSVLDELDGPRCDALLGRTDSAEVLADLYRRTQLLVAVDEDEVRLRCHHLLAEELASDLRTLAPAQIAGLHERASHWYASQGDREASIRHALASGDVALCSEMIWPAVPSTVASGRLDSLGRWLGGLDDGQIAADRWLTMAAAVGALQRGDAAALGHWARTAQAHAGPDWRSAARSDPYAATLAVLRALMGSGGLDGVRDLCESALQGLAPDDPFRTAAAFNRGIVLILQRDVDGGSAGLREAARLGRDLGVPVVEANAMAWLGLGALSAGERARGIELVSQAAEVARRHHLDRLATGAVSATAQALVLALVGDKSAASAALVTARRLTGLAAGIAPWFGVAGRAVQARTAVLLGDGATARLLITEAREHLTPELAASAAGDALAQAEDALTHLSDRGGSAGVLTTSELRVLQFLPSHLTLGQIGEHLFVSQATVKTHVLSIYRKFGVDSRAGAVAHARRLGLVEGPVEE